MNNFILPFTQNSHRPSSTRSASSRSNSFAPVTTTTSPAQSLKKMVKRLFKPTTLDFETAMWEFTHLIINPKKMYRSQYYKQYQGNKTYSRDDPSFLILLTIFLSISAVAWGLTYSPKVVDIIKLIIYMVFVDFYLTGIGISTASWLVMNKMYNGTWGLNRYNVNYIEWNFCFDVHCNSFLIIWCLLYLVQFIMLPVITIENSFISLFLGNGLYFVAIGYYFVITFYGFNSLPINGDNKVLQLVIVGGILPVLGFVWFLSLCFRVNVANIMIDTYFN